MSKIKEIIEKEKRAKEFIERMKDSVADKEKIESLMADQNQNEILNYLEYIGTGEDYLNVPADVEIIKSEMTKLLENENAVIEPNGDILLKNTKSINEVRMHAEKDGNIRFSNDKFFSSPNTFIESASIWRTTVKMDKYGAMISRASSGIGGDWASSERINDNQIKTEATDGASYEDSDIYEDFGNPFSLEKSEDKDVMDNFKRATKLYPSLRTWFFKKYPERVDEFIETEKTFTNQEKDEKEENQKEELTPEERKEFETLYLELKDQIVSIKINNLEHLNKLMDLYKTMNSLKCKSFKTNSPLMVSLKYELAPLIKANQMTPEEMNEDKDKSKDKKEETKESSKKVADMSDDELAKAYLEAKQDLRNENTTSNYLDQLTSESKKMIVSMRKEIDEENEIARKEQEQRESKKPRNIIKNAVKKVVSKIKSDDDDAR